MIRILFICHGNICRSAAACYVMKELVRKSGKEKEFLIDSAATSTEEIGNPVYPPMRKTLLDHGIPCGGHHARQMTRRDYDAFDYLIAMDQENLYYMNRMYGKDPEGKFRMLMDFAGRPGQEVADPWYTRDFEAAYRDVDAGCRGLLEALSP